MTDTTTPIAALECPECGMDIEQGEFMVMWAGRWHHGGECVESAAQADGYESAFGHMVECPAPREQRPRGASPECVCDPDINRRDPFLAAAGRAALTEEQA